MVFIFHGTTKVLSTTKERKERGKCVLGWSETKKKALIKVLGDFFFNRRRCFIEFLIARFAKRSVLQQLKLASRLAPTCLPMRIA